MGQGLYHAIVFGAIDPPMDETDEDDYTDLAPWADEAIGATEKAHGVHFDSSYEAEPYYRGVTVAVSDGCLGRYWKVPTFDRCVVPFGDLRAWANERFAAHLGRAAKAWEDIRAAGGRAGVEVPEGELLLVSDWD